MTKQTAPRPRFNPPPEGWGAGAWHQPDDFGVSVRQVPRYRTVKIKRIFGDTRRVRRPAGYDTERWLDQKGIGPSGTGRAMVRSTTARPRRISRPGMVPVPGGGYADIATARTLGIKTGAAYAAGFMNKCAELGVDPRSLAGMGKTAITYGR